MVLLPADVAASLPPLYSDEDTPLHLKVPKAKFFDPCGSWTWYALEYDPAERIFFGYVDGLDRELGYFSLDELESITRPFGLGIERDLHFTPRPLGELYPDLAPTTALAG